MLTVMRLKIIWKMRRLEKGDKTMKDTATSIMVIMTVH